MWPGRTVAAVCRGPAAFSHTKAPDGSPLVKGRSVTGFANSEEAAIGLTHVVPFLVEDMLKENGGIYSKAADWQPHVIVDGNLITGQNPASAQGGGRAVLQGLAADAAPSKEHQQSTAGCCGRCSSPPNVTGSCHGRPSLGTSGHPASVVA
jgi:putative intracellular protease/amidase